MISGGREVVFIAGKPDLGDDGSKPSVKVIFCSTDSFGDTEVAVANGALIEVAGFRASLGETLLVNYGGQFHILTGVGSSNSLTTDSMRRAGAATLKAAMNSGVLELDVESLANIYHESASVVDNSLSLQEISRLAIAFGQGISLAAYSFDKYKSTKNGTGRDADTGREQVKVFLPLQPDNLAQEIAKYIAVTTRAICLARDLVNEPATDLPPARFAEAAREIAQSSNLSVEILDEEGARKEGLGGLLGVSRGSNEECRLIKLTYNGSMSGSADEAKPTTAKVALVGKGITFDSGGLSLKSAEAMMTMKTDMAGAAAVLATMSVLNELKVPLDVVGIMAMSENLPSGSATKPGDVLKTRSGQTIEVLNTDAEGRLVLADALTLATEENPDAIIDLATLTGACVVALGESVAGVMTNDQRLVDMLTRAAKTSGEKFWQLPLPHVYQPMIESEVADMKNVASKPKAGALIAGLILEKFVGDIPWIHLDIAGPARSDTSQGFLTKGATGFGVLTLIELLQSWEILGAKAMGAKNC